MKAAVKVARKLKTENKDEALKQLAVAYKAIDKRTKRGVIKKAPPTEKIPTGKILGKVNVHKQKSRLKRDFLFCSILELVRTYIRYGRVSSFSLVRNKNYNSLFMTKHPAIIS